MAMNNHPEPKKSLVYGSLYMDQAESYEFAEMQIDQCIKSARTTHERIIVAFDIVATPEQIALGRAREWGQHILDYCDREYPNLSARVVGITDDNHRRLWRDMLLTQKVTPADIDGIHMIEM